MAGQFNSLAQNLLEKAQKNNIDMSTISSIMESPEGKNFMKHLSGGGGDSLKKAASAAADGDSGSAARMISSLLSTKEGRDLAQQVMNITKKK